MAMCSCPTFAAGGASAWPSCPIYARERVSHAWLVDPVAQTLEGFRLESGRWVMLGVWRNDAKVRVEPFDAVELGPAELWAR